MQRRPCREGQARRGGLNLCLNTRAHLEHLFKSQLLFFCSSPINGPGYLLAPATHWGDPGIDPGSLLRPGQALSVAVIWGLNQKMENLSFPLSLFLYLSNK